ncbi:MAG: glucuronate isomerase [Alphaproteobacteria bacterium]|nr:glucuronate isomerase [Alphaproteobacteria bacterium]
MPNLNHPDRLFPADPDTRAIARELYDQVKDLPIVSPHGHTDPRWYAQNKPFPDPAQLLIVPDHYAVRMLVSQGIGHHELGVRGLDGSDFEADGRTIWRLFAKNYHLFAGTPTRAWLDHTLEFLFGVDTVLDESSADAIYDHIAECLTQDQYLPRALFSHFNIEVIATTEAAIDDLKWHKMIADSDWDGRVITAYRPDSVIDPDNADFSANLDLFGELSGCDTGNWAGYLDAHRNRRAFFAAHGATSTDHGHLTADTANLSEGAAGLLFDKIRTGGADVAERALFRGQMLTEMARMSIEDGLVMQIHPGSWRGHSPTVHARFGPDKGFDIPKPTNYVAALKPLLDEVGMDPRLTLVLFTLDEGAYSRELAPLAGAYPALRLGPAWWFYDSPEGMRRYRQLTTETAGFYNTVGFNDDTRAFPSIPARHDMARRIDCGYLAGLIAEHQLRPEEGAALARELAYGLAKKTYKL